MTKTTKCQVKDCKRPYFQAGYCAKHYNHIRRHGQVMERTRFDANQYIDKGDHYEIVLYSGYGIPTEAGRALIDKDDLERAQGYKWCILVTRGYKYVRAHRPKSNKTLKLSHLITNRTDDISKVRFINRNTLDHRKVNLIKI